MNDIVEEDRKADLENIEAIRKRDDLPELERAVSDTLDEYLMRIHGIASSWAHPSDFMRWLNQRGYKVIGRE